MNLERLTRCTLRAARCTRHVTRCALHVARCTLILAACARDTQIEIVASLEPGVPLEGLEIAVLPYDPERLLDSLAALATTPRPDYSALEDELLAFERPSYAEDDQAVRVWAAVRDSVTRLSDSLNAVDRRSPGYAAAYERLRHMYQRFLQKTAARDAGVRELTAEVRDVAMRAGRAADSLRAWEREAFAAFDSLAARAESAVTRMALTHVTGSEGGARMSLPRGDWWLAAELPHPENPFVEYQWRVPVTVGPFPVRVPLDGRTVRLAWRH